MKTHTNQTTKIISAPPPASIPSSISILVENAGYTRLSIKPRTPILEQLFNTFQVYYKCSDSYKASHHHFLFVKYTFNNYSISLTPEYLCSPREEQLPEAEKLQLKETRIQDDLYLPFALIKQFIDDFFKTMTEEGNSNSKIIDGTITAIRELYALIYSSNQLSIQRYPIFLRFAGKPLTINFSTILIFPKSTKFHQKIPGIPSKYGIFYCNEDSLPSYLDYFNSKYGILNGIREEHINKLIIPQADKDFYDGVIKSGVLLTVFSIISGVAWLLNWNVLAVIGGILWIGVGAHIFVKKRNQFATTYNKNQDNHFFSYLKFTPDQVAATMKHFIVPQHKELFKAEYSFTHSIKVKSPNVPVVKTKPQKPVIINPPTSTIIKSEALFGDLANFFD